VRTAFVLSLGLVVFGVAPVVADVLDGGRPVATDSRATRSIAEGERAPYSGYLVTRERLDRATACLETGGASCPPCPPPGGVPLLLCGLGMISAGALGVGAGALFRVRW